VSLSPEQIVAEEFRLRTRGYDRDEVDAFLDRLADQVEADAARLRSVEQRAAALETELAAVRDREATLTRTLATVQDAADRARADADAEVAALRTATERELAEVRERAEQDAQRVRADAEQEAAELRGRLREVQELDASHRAALQGRLEQQLEELRSLPDPYDELIARVSGAEDESGPGPVPGAGDRTEAGREAARVEGDGPAPFDAPDDTRDDAPDDASDDALGDPPDDVPDDAARDVREGGDEGAAGAGGDDAPGDAPDDADDAPDLPAAQTSEDPDPHLPEEGTAADQPEADAPVDPWQRRRDPEPEDEDEAEERDRPVEPDPPIWG